MKRYIRKYMTKLMRVWCNGSTEASKTSCKGSSPLTRAIQMRVDCLPSIQSHTMEILKASELADTEIKVKCDCGYKIPTLPPHSRWRKVQCDCGILWWVKLSGRVFEKHFELKDIDY